jgi:hypothetical protein
MSLQCESESRVPQLDIRSLVGNYGVIYGRNPDSVTFWGSGQNEARITLRRRKLKYQRVYAAGSQVPPRSKRTNYGDYGRIQNDLSHCVYPQRLESSEQQPQAAAPSEIAKHALLLLSAVVEILSCAC